MGFIPYRQFAPLRPKGKVKCMSYWASAKYPISKVRSIYFAKTHPPGRLLRSARKDTPRFLLRGKWHEVPIGDKKYVILSVSEISHDQSEKYIPVSSSVEFFTPVIRRIMLSHFKTIVLHFCKMPAPYEYRRSQTLASKFARLALTQRQTKKCVIIQKTIKRPLQVD